MKALPTGPLTPRATRWIRVRMIVVALVLMVGFGAVAWRATQLQVRESPKLRALAEEQYLKTVELPPRRGPVLFRDGTQLATSLEVDSVWVNARAAPDDAATAAALAEALDRDPAAVRAKLRSRRYVVWLKRRVPPDEARAVRKLAIRGVTLTTEPRRYYPNGALAGPLIGFAGIDSAGLEGVELAMDSVLRGAKASVPGLKDALGRVVYTMGMPEDDPTSGATVELTVDRFIQFSAERALAAGVKAARAKAGSAIVMDPRTGEVLAIANVPSFDPNRPKDHVKLGARNRAVTDPFEPGSTMKVFTLAAALDTRSVRPDDLFDGEKGELKIGKYTIHDSHDHEQLTASECLKVSSNICAAKIARRLGRERLEDYLHRFGFGQRTGIELPGERAGILRPSARWGEIGLATLSFGQGMTASPLQVLTGISAVANGGLYLPPRIVQRVRGPRGEVLEERPIAEGRRVMGERAVRELTAMMVSVTDTGGTAEQAAMEGFTVAGKTGTAQKVDPRTGRYAKSLFVASFGGFVPAGAPRLAILVVIDEPDPEKHYGGEVAAPVFKQIAEESLRYLGVTHQERKVAALPASGGTASEGPALIGQEQPVAEIMREQAEVASATDPLAGAGAALAGADSDAELGLGELGAVSEARAATLVPDFTGMSLGQAVTAARRAGLRLEITGHGVAIGQSPGPGRVVRGARCRIAFRPPAEGG